jgi:methionyl-tRNA synthetase
LEEGIKVHQICYNFYKLHKEIFKWFISALTNVVELLEKQTEIAQDKEGYTQ